MLDELADERRRRILKWAFTEPDQLKPGKTRQQLTEEAAVRALSGGVESGIPNCV